MKKAKFIVIVSIFLSTPVSANGGGHPPGNQQTTVVNSQNNVGASAASGSASSSSASGGQATARLSNNVGLNGGTNNSAIQSNLSGGNIVIDGSRFPHLVPALPAIITNESRGTVGGVTTILGGAVISTESRRYRQNQAAQLMCHASEVLVDAAILARQVGMSENYDLVGIAGASQYHCAAKLQKLSARH